MLNTWTFLFILVLSFELSAKLGSKKFLWHFVLKKPTKKRKTLGTLLMLTNVAFLVRVCLCTFLFVPHLVFIYVEPLHATFHKYYEFHNEPTK